MNWRSIRNSLYRTATQPPGVGRGGDLSRATDASREDADAQGDRDMADAAYRKFVEAAATSGKESGIILNRSAGHAAVVLEFIFQSAQKQVRVLTSQLSADVYGSEGVISAAVSLLSAHPSATIDILTESKIERRDHPLLARIDAAGFSDRVTLRRVPDEAQTYEFNFAVADGMNYRFESSRHTREAIVQFKDGAFASDLDKLFDQLNQSAVD